MRLTLVVTMVCGVLLCAAATGRADGLHSTTFAGTLVEVETTDASAILIGANTTQARAAAFDLDGTLYTTVNSGEQLATFDLETGALDVVGPLHSYGSMDAIEIDASGELYGVTRTGYAYRIDKASGAPTYVSYLSVRGINDLAYDPDGNLWAVADNRLYVIDVQTGADLLVGAIVGAEGFVAGIAFDAKGHLWATSSVQDAPLYEIDLDTLAVRLVGRTGVAYPMSCDLYVPAAPPAPLPPPDADADGYPDDVDAFPHSDLRSTVWVGDRDTGVENVLFDDGATIADLVAACAEGARNYGTFVNRVAHVCNTLRSGGWLTGAEHSAIQRAAARSFR